MLGFPADKNGYFADELNKKAGIPSDYKIHSDTMAYLIWVNTKTNHFVRYFHELDIAKTKKMPIAYFPKYKEIFKRLGKKAKEARLKQLKATQNTPNLNQELKTALEEMMEFLRKIAEEQNSELKLRHTQNLFLKIYQIQITNIKSKINIRT